MKKIVLGCFISLALMSLGSCGKVSEDGVRPEPGRSVHVDSPFLQEISVKYYFDEAGAILKKVHMDRNGTVQVLSDQGLLRPHDGQFLYPGSLIDDRTYLPMKDKNLKDLTIYQNQFVYLDDRSVLSNAWAGSLFVKHALSKATLFQPGKDFSFLVAAEGALGYFADSTQVWSGSLSAGAALAMEYDAQKELFYLLTPTKVLTFAAGSNVLSEVFSGSGFTSFALTNGGQQLVIGTNDGYLQVDTGSWKQLGERNNRLPWPELTAVAEIHGQLWFGSTRGAFMQKEDGRFNYYYGERWLPGDRVAHLAPGQGKDVLILTDKGLAKLEFFEHTLHQKAEYFDRQMRERHIRYGFNATLVGMEKGNINSGRLGDSDNDGLWTSMYLGGEAFRYAVTGEEEALQNIRESLDAMERLYTINPIEGFPSRSFARRGYINQLSDPERWQPASHPEWDWKATTSSDEAIGHAFVFGVIAELVEDQEVKDQAVRLIDALMQHIVENDWYLIDYDGKPTLWGKWHPDYVNNFPRMVGDRKLNSSNIISMLQTAYHFTQKEIYKTKAFELMNDHGYLENMMVPMELIGKAEEGTDEWAEMLSESWNHSDDEMYFLGYWGLYRYAFNDTLKAKYKESIIDHWESERPEKEGLWNIFTALVAPDNFDLEEAVWYLQEYPLDLINWSVQNSHRKDVTPIAENFRRQTLTEVLPPDELPIRRHNANRFGLDAGGMGRSENSPGDIWLLPYWMGRYLGVISAP
ncbi:MAG: hypothetical protein JJU34_02480 [Lunatimonas sp.]|uniref:hypothetical protein n=1 Tax=Lunatimonas sp. TaxID=2060141 RepID=UPI00263A61FB|nr:hypothetical protein [Lunatimonas sp.]MCC5936126.1 hypothetical protein [Lunatimonas sp.]